MPSAGWLARRFELARGGAGENLLPMEGLRGLAVALVFGVHYGSLAQPWFGGDWEHAGFEALHTMGHAGVDLFFLLSGFLIYGHLIRRPQPFMRYMARRLQRIYPAFLAVFAVYIVLAWLMPQRGKLPDGDTLWPFLLANLLLLPGLFPIEPLITVAWSLSYEMFFYLVMPLLIVVLGLRRQTAGGRVLALGAVLMAMLLACALLGGPVRMSMFIAGALLAELLPARRGPGTAVGAAAGLGALVLMLAPLPGADGQAWRIAGLALGFGLLCHAALAGRAPALAAVLCWRPLRWLGNMSYSYYLLHGLALHVFFAGLARLPLPTDAVGWGVVLLLPAFAWTLLPSAMLFLLVERPFSLATAPPPVPAATSHQPG